MSITRMCSENTPGAERQSMRPWQATMTCSGWYQKGWQGQQYRPTDERDDFWTHTTHKGLVLGTGENNHYDDSDFYAVVWNPETCQTERIEYASTRGWTYPNHADVDATPEVIQAAKEYRDKLIAQAQEARAHRQAKDPQKGSTVVVVAGRGPNKFQGTWKGAEGVVFWRGANQFKTYYRNGYNRPDSVSNQVVGFKTADGQKVFTALTNVRVKGFEKEVLEPVDIHAGMFVL